jgi:hypothetical protein
LAIGVPDSIWIPNLRFWIRLLSDVIKIPKRESLRDAGTDYPVRFPSRIVYEDGVLSAEVGRGGLSAED